MKEIILNIKSNTNSDISFNSNVIRDLDLSSFEIFVLIHDVETEFGIEITEQNITNNFKIKDLINIIMHQKDNKFDCK